MWYMHVFFYYLKTILIISKGQRVIGKVRRCIAISSYYSSRICLMVTFSRMYDFNFI